MSQISEIVEGKVRQKASEKRINFKSQFQDRVEIVGSDNGSFIVTVGCCRMTYFNVADLLDDLEIFCLNQQKYLKSAAGSKIKQD